MEGNELLRRAAGFTPAVWFRRGKPGGALGYRRPPLSNRAIHPPRGGDALDNQFACPRQLR
jgi:hypothetical protein